MKKNTLQTLIIKKYENRRLYNTLTSQYINQEQVAQLVRDGYDVRVVDAATGEDLTRLILAQIVLEDAKTPDSVFPLDVLRQMIVASGRATQEGALRYMKAMLDMYQNAYRALPPSMNPFEFMQARWVPSSAEAGGPHAPGMARGGPKQNDEQPPIPEGAKVEAAKVDELKQRIEELESLLSKRGPRKTAKKKSRRKA
jgi:polyhydroxyalkanoate synthesis repressor PhaR